MWHYGGIAVLVRFYFAARVPLFEARTYLVGSALLLLIIGTVVLVSQKREPADSAPLAGASITSDGGRVSPGADPTPYPSPGHPEICEHFFQLVCARRDVTADPTGNVSPNVRGEVEALRDYEKIIHEHPGWTSDQVDDELVKEIYTDRRRKHLQETFDWVLVMEKEFIDRQPPTVFTPAVKAKLKERLSATKLELPPPAALYETEPDLFTKNEIYYETLGDGRRVIRVGGAYILTAKSWFNRVFTFAHELAHAIDPCELESIPLELPAYHRLAACFSKHGIVHKSMEPVKCGEKNRLGESFADWIAAEITSEALVQRTAKFKNFGETLNSAINSVRDLCNQESWLDESESELYPEPHIRIGVLFAKNPRIAHLLGCAIPEGKDSYCTFDWSSHYETKR